MAIKARKEGIYRTEYGNAAVVNGGKAFDLDMAERIPMAFVTDERIRDADQAELGLLEENINEVEDFDED